MAPTFFGIPCKFGHATYFLKLLFESEDRPHSIYDYNSRVEVGSNFIEKDYEERKEKGKVWKKAHIFYDSIYEKKKNNFFFFGVNFPPPPSV